MINKEGERGGGAGGGPRTLAIDCGGTGLKATVLDAAGAMLCPRARVRTPYPCPPKLLLATLVDLAAATATPFDRASVGFPGLVRHGVVRATPHYVTEAGPFTARRGDLVDAWRSFDVQTTLQEALGVPTRVLNDAEIAGLAVIGGTGYEIMITLGTGLGFAAFDDGRVLPKVELSQARTRGGVSFDQRLGHHTRKRIGNAKWVRRVHRALDDLRPVLWWDHLYVGGGGAKHLPGPIADDVTVVGNEQGLLGGVRLWA